MNGYLMPLAAVLPTTLDTVLQIMAYASIPIAATVLGGIVAAFRPPGPKMSAAIQHFAAGVVFAAVATEILPDVMHRREPVHAVIGFALGIGLMLGLRWWTERLEATAATGAPAGAPAGAVERVLPLGLILTVGVDILIDGLLIGIGFAAGQREGVLLTIALTLEVLFIGMAVMVELGRSDVSRARSIAIVAGLALLLAVGAAIGAVLLAGLSNPMMELVLAFGCAALLYLVTEELLVEAHEGPDTPLITALFFVGFLALIVVEMVS